MSAVANRPLMTSRFLSRSTIDIPYFDGYNYMGMECECEAQWLVGPQGNISLLDVYIKHIGQILLPSQLSSTDIEWLQKDMIEQQFTHF